MLGPQGGPEQGKVAAEEGGGEEEEEGWSPAPTPTWEHRVGVFRGKKMLGPPGEGQSFHGAGL